MTDLFQRVPLIQLPLEEERDLGSIEVLSNKTKIKLPLKSVDISARVADSVAEVKVKQTYSNQFDVPVLATYIFPLSAGSAVSSFIMRAGDTTVVGEVKERAQARQEFKLAIAEGKQAAMLEQERDNIFTMQVGNLPPNEDVEVELVYSESLPFFEDGHTEIRLPLVVGKRYIAGNELNRQQTGTGSAEDTDVVPDASRITPARLAKGAAQTIQLKLGVELVVPAQAEIEGLGCTQHAVKTRVSSKSIKVELARDDERLDRDFVLQWKLAESKLTSRLYVHKTPEGEAFGMLSVLPPSRDGYLGAPRDVLFMVDVSGSMQGSKLASATKACSILLETLGPNDRFAIQAFESGTHWLLPKGTRSSAEKFYALTEENRKRGHKFLSELHAMGGTEMYGALGEAIAEIAGRQQTTGRVPVIVMITDAEVGDEARILDRISRTIGDTRVFTIGIDTVPNQALLNTMASLGGGTSTTCTPGVELESALVTISREIGKPLVTHLRLVKADVAEVAPSRLPDLFAGRAVTAFMKLKSEQPIRIVGDMEDGALFDETLAPEIVELPAIAHMWARTRISDLEYDFRSGARPRDQIRAQIIETSIAHQVLCRFTAYLAIDHSRTVKDTDKLMELNQLVEEPYGWENTSPSQGWGSASFGALSGASFGSLGAFGAAPPPPGSPSPASASSESVQAWSPDGEQIQTGMWQPFDQNMQNIGSFGGPAVGGTSGGWGGPPAAARSRSSIGFSSEDVNLIKTLLTRFAEVLEKAFAEIKAGRVPSTTELDVARKSLVKYLTSTLIGSQLPKLQVFLRQEAIELVASVETKDVSAAGLEPLWERAMKVFTEAQVESTNHLDRLGTSGGGTGAFWETTI